jgi:hypothetical protein
MVVMHSTAPSHVSAIPLAGAIHLLLVHAAMPKLLVRSSLRL